MGHMLETFIFSSRKRSDRQKWIWFGVLAGAIFLCFWWFKAVAMGIDGPINEHKGLGWRKVGSLHCVTRMVLTAQILPPRIQSWNVSLEVTFPILCLAADNITVSRYTTEVYDPQNEIEQLRCVSLAHAYTDRQQRMNKHS
jgi:hypothetical protein